MIAPFASVTAPLMVPNKPWAAKLLGQKLPIAKITAITVKTDLAFVILISKNVLVMALTRAPRNIWYARA